MDQQKPSKQCLAASNSQNTGDRTDANLVDDVSNTSMATPVGRLHQRHAHPPTMQTPTTPQECASMVHAVEEAIKKAQDVTPDSGRTVSKMPNLQAWLDASGMQLPTPAAKDLKALAAAAADSKLLRKQLEALRDAELELAAREAEENAQNFSMLEDENLSLAADNARLKQKIAELESLTREGPAGGAGRRTAVIDDRVDGVQARVAMALQRAEDARRRSGVYEEEQLASFRQLNQAEEQLSAVKSQRPGSTQPQQAALQQRLQQAEEQVHAAAAAAQAASQKLEVVLKEKETVHHELQAIKQQLESGTAAQQHAELYHKLVEAHQLMQVEKQQQQRLTGSLLEHAGRLSHKYYTLSDDYGALQNRYHHLASTNDQLALQLKEAHEALYELQSAVQATPPAKRKEQQRLLACVADAEQAVKTLAQEKTQLQERLLQAQAFVACLQQRSGARNLPGRSQKQYLETPTFISATTAAATPGATQLCLPASRQVAAAAAGVNDEAEAQLKATGLMVAGGGQGSATSSFGDFETPVKGRSNPLFDLPATPAGGAHTAPAPAGVQHTASFPVEPVSPILAAAAAALTACVGQQQQQQIKWSAANTELQHVQQEQLGLRNEIIKAKSALADIASQLRGSIGSGVAATPPAHVARSTRSRSAATSKTATVSSNKAPGSAKSSSARSASSGSHSSSSSGGSRKAPSASTGGILGWNNGASQHSKLRPTPAETVSSQGSRVPMPRAAALAAQQRSKQATLVPCRVTVTEEASKSASHSNVSAQQQKQHRSCQEDFSFPCLSMNEQELQLLSSGKSANSAAAAAAAASPQESTGSAGSLVGSQHTLEQQRAAAVASSIARMLSHQATSAPASAVGALQQQTQQQQTKESSSCKKDACSQGCSNVGGAVSAESDPKSKACSGSLSLDQLIADAESVSLEYGMSPAVFSAATKAESVDTPTSSAVTCTPGCAASGPLASKQAPGSVVEQQQLNAAAAAAAALAKAFAAPTPGYSGPFTASWATTPDSNQASVCLDRRSGLTEASMLQPQFFETPCTAAGSVVSRCMAAQVTPAESISDSDVDWLLLQQQEQERIAHERLAICLADTPGSASSSAGGGAAARLWLEQQAQPMPRSGLQQAGYTVANATPSPLVYEAVDMQSAVRPVQGSSRAVAVDCSVTPLEMRYATTPAGAEQAASNVVVSEVDRFEATPVHGNQLQQRSLLTPSFVTPTIIADQRAAAAAAHPYSQATADDATSGCRKQDEQDQVEAAAAAAAGGYEHLMAVQWMPHPGCTPPLTAPALPQSPDAAADAVPTPTASVAAATPVSQQLTRPATAQDTLQTPAATPAAAAAHSTEPSPLQCAATALLASITPAGLISPGEVVPAHIVKYMTPEWMRQLRQRCQEGTVQVQQLRQQLGLATPPSVTEAEAAGASQSLQHQQEEQQAENAEQDTAVGPATSQGHTVSWLPAGVTPGTAGSTAPVAAADSTAFVGSVGAASARHSIDRLRRRAIAQAATSTAARRAADATYVDTENNEAANTTPADLEGVFAVMAATEACSSISRTDSGGSLAQYMVHTQQSGPLPCASSCPNSRCGSGMLYTRPDCPTPGSVYSVASGRGSASPDLLLAGLSNSRLMARQLQMELQHQLDGTAPPPALSKQEEQQPLQHRFSEEGAAGEGHGGQHMAAQVAGISDQPGEPHTAVAAEAAEDGNPECAAGDPQQPGETVPSEEEPTPLRGTASKSHSQQEATDSAEAASPLTPGAALNAGADSCMLRGTATQIAATAASPFTPGAVLNAQAESRLLSPSMDLEQIFIEADDSEGEADAKTTATAADEEDAGAAVDSQAAVALNVSAEWRAVTTHPVKCIVAHQLSSMTTETLTGTVTPAKRAGSITPVSDARVTLTSAVVETYAALEAASTAVAADICDVGACLVKSVEAHQLSNIAANTVTATGDVASGTGSVTPVSDARVAIRSSKCSGEQCQGHTDTAAESEATHPSLGSWATQGATAAATSSASIGCWADAVAAAAARSPEAVGSSNADAARYSSTSCPADHIFLGDSPTSSRCSGRTDAAMPGSPAGQLSIASNNMASSNSYSCSASAAALGDTARVIVTPGSCYSVHAPKVSLGDSPQSCCDMLEDVSPAVQRQQHPDHMAAQLPILPAATAAAAPSAGATSITRSDCMYATPAMASESPGISSSAAASGQQVYYTAMQYTARSTAGASGSRPAVEQAGIVAFGGFGRADYSPAASAGQPGASATIVLGDLHAATEPSVGSAACGATAAEPAPEASENESSLLQQLLDSPNSSSCHGSPAWVRSATAQATSNSMRDGTPCARETHVQSASSAASTAAGQACALQGRESASHILMGSVAQAGCVSNAASEGSSVRAGSAAGTTSAAAAAAISACLHSDLQDVTSDSTVSAQMVNEKQHGVCPERPVTPSCTHGTSQLTPPSSGHSSTSRSSGTQGSCSKCLGVAQVATANHATQIMSPTFSDLGFIDAPTEADYQTAQHLQQEQAEQQQQQGLESMTFEQRLALLCASSGDESDSGSSISTCGHQQGQEDQRSEGGIQHAARSSADAAAIVAHQEGGQSTAQTTPCSAAQQQQQQEEELEDEHIVYTPLLPSHLASRATQTSPLLAEASTQRSGDVRDTETQVTPALHDSGSRSRSKIRQHAACDVTASPVKVRDQSDG